MADYDRNRSRYDEENRGAFGYEGEGYLRGGGRDVEDRWRREWDRDRWNEEQRFRRGFDIEGYGDYNRGDYIRPGTPPQSFRGRGPKNYQRSDERIREEVCEWLEEDDRVDATDIEVAVKDGVVMLSGSIDDRSAKRRAEDIAESISGVKDVQNQIRVSRERD